MNGEFCVSAADAAHFRDHLKGLCWDELNIAIIGRDSARWGSALIAAGLCGARISVLDETLQIHQYKRLLNEHGCNCLIYSQDFAELAYMLENTGTTMVAEYIPMDDMTAEGSENCE